MISHRSDSLEMTWGTLSNDGASVNEGPGTSTTSSVRELLQPTETISKADMDMNAIRMLIRQWYRS